MAQPQRKEKIRCSCLNPATKFLEEKAKEIKTSKTLVRGTPASTAKSIMYTGGTIRTIESGVVDKIVDAVGFHAGKVVAAGTVDQVTAKMRNASKNNYDTVRLSRGQTLLPGFIEPHMHVPMTAMMVAGMMDLSPFEGQYVREKYDSDWLKEEISERKKEIPDGFWILGHSVDPAMMPYTIKEDGLNVLQRLDVDVVDELEKEIPVLMMSTGHSAYVNTAALEIIYEKVKPEFFESFDKFREFVNANNGLQEIEQVFPALTAVPLDQVADIVSKTDAGLDILLEIICQRGITFLNEAAMTPDLMETIMNPYFEKHPPRVRMGYAQLCNTLDEFKGLEKYEKLTDVSYCFPTSVKVVSDGSNQGLTGFQTESYRCEPKDNTGIENFTLQELKDILNVVIKEKGWPVLLHANGDAAIEKALTAYEAVLGGESGLAKRHRIEHCSLLNKANIQKMADLGLSPSFLIGHVTYWGYVFKTGIFEERVNVLIPCQSAVSKGMRISLHSDYWVTPPGPLRIMEQAITRIMERDPEGNVLNHDEKLTPAQALRAVTYDAAWQCQVDKWVGSLEVGKKADYVILGEDPITRKDPVGIRNIPVLETWVGGVKVGHWEYK